MYKSNKISLVLLFASFFVINSTLKTDSAEVVTAPKMSEGAEKLAKLCSDDIAIDEDNNSFFMTSEQEALFDTYSNLVYYFEDMAEGDDEYPNYISGIYYNESEGLVVTTSENVEIVKELVDKITCGSSVKIKKVQYSYNELKDMKLDLEEVCLRMFSNSENDVKDLISRIVNVSVDEVDNCLYVQIENLSNNDEKLFKSTVSSNDCIHVVNYEIQECSTDLSPGSRVFAIGHELGNGRDAYLGYSIGCRAWRILSDGRYEYGFITAMHGLTVGDKFYIGTYYNDDQYIGKVTDISNTLETDAAFVKVERTSKFNLSNDIAYSSFCLSSGSYVASDFKGIACGFSGATTNQIIFGRITEENSELIKFVSSYKWIENGNTIFAKSEHLRKNLLIATLTTWTDFGDSGGLLFCKSNNKYCVLGFMVGMTKETRETYFTKYVNVNRLKNWNVY